MSITQPSKKNIYKVKLFLKWPWNTLQLIDPWDDKYFMPNQNHNANISSLVIPRDWF